MQPRLSENPWFWLMLFGSLGAAGVVVIGPKYAARQARLERMAETGERVRAARELGTSATEVRKARPEKIAAEEVKPNGAGRASQLDSATGGSAAGGTVARDTAAKKGPIEPYVESDFGTAPRLSWLLGVMIVLMLAGTAGMILSRRRQTA
jgi:hypothetical protein